MSFGAAAEVALGQEGARALRQLVDEQRARRGFADHVTADSLIGVWEWLVDEVERGYDDVIEEYANDLSSRAILDDLLAVAPAQLARTIRTWSDPLDRRFLDATTRAEKPFHGSADPKSPYAASRWHWQIPKKLVGALRADLSGS